MSEKDQSKKPALKQLQQDLRSDNDDTVLRALENSRSIGKSEITPLLISLLLHSNEEIAQEAEKIIFSLKDSGSAQHLIDALDDVSLTPIHNKLIAAFWMSGLDASPYLLRIVRAGVEGSFLVCMEVYSVLDNSEVEDLPHDQVMESLLLLNNYFEKHPKEDKTELIKDIARMLQET